MKSFKQFREECGCKDKERKSKSKKKTSNVEVMPTVDDGQKGMVTKTTNESVFAGNYQGPLYARHPDLVIAEKAVSKKQQKFMGMVRAAQKGEGASSPEVAKVASSMKKGDVKKFASTKHKGLPEKKVQKETFETGVQKARRDYRSGTLLTFKQFVSKLTDILDEWEK